MKATGEVQTASTLDGAPTLRTGQAGGREGLLTSTRQAHGGAGEPSAGDRLSLRRLVRAASGLSLATLLSPALALGASVLAARWLGPDAYGRGQAVLLVYLLASLVRTGIFEGGVRAYVHAAASGDYEAARRAQNVAFTIESIVSLVPGMLLLAGAFFVDDHIRRTGFLLAPVAVLATSVASYLNVLHVARERFSVISWSALIRAVVAPAALLVTIPRFGAVAVVLSPIVADVAVITILFVARPRLELHVTFDAAIARPLLRTGLPLGLAAIVYWAYRLVGSTSVALARSPLEYGIFAFAATPVTVLARGIASMHTVLMPAIWGEIGDEERTGKWGRPAARTTILLAVMAGALCSACQAGFGPAVYVLAPKFIRSIPILEILAFNILLLSVAAVPSLVLDSAVVNRQVRHLVVWIIALAVNTAANAAVLAGGAGLLAVAVNDIVVQVGVLIAIYAMSRPHMPDDWPDRAVLAWVCGCAALTVALLLVLRQVLPDPADLGALVTSLVLRLGLAGLVWSSVAVAFRVLVRAAPPEGGGDEPFAR